MAVRQLFHLKIAKRAKVSLHLGIFAAAGRQSQDCSPRTPRRAAGALKVKDLKGLLRSRQRAAPAGGQDLRLIYPKSRADYPRCSAVECARSQRLARSLSDNSAVTSEFNALFTDTFIYSSMAVLALCAFAAMWIIRK